MLVAKCHPNKKYGARGMCCTCYNKWLRKNNTRYGKRAKERVKELQASIVKEHGVNWARHRSLQYRYKITLAEYNRMLKSQKSKCAICGKAHDPAPKKKLHVDHCHTTDKVRGLLCARCNGFMGTVDINPLVVGELVKYIINAAK